MTALIEVSAGAAQTAPDAVLVYSTLLIPASILFEAALDYLGDHSRPGDLRHGHGLQPLR